MVDNLDILAQNQVPRTIDLKSGFVLVHSGLLVHTRDIPRSNYEFCVLEDTTTRICFDPST